MQNILNKILNYSGRKIVFITNQNGISKGYITENDFKSKVEAIMKKISVPIQVSIFYFNCLIFFKLFFFEKKTVSVYFCYTGDKRNCDGLLANNNNCFVYFFTVLFIRTEEKVNDTSLTQVAYKRKNYIRFMFFFCRKV